MSLPPRFACDVMLGRTAKWLRIIGFDTFYDNRSADPFLRELCLDELRILLTKDVALHQAMPAGLGFLVAAVRPRQQLQEIVNAFRLDRFPMPPRCSLCNGELAAIKKALVENMVPPYVFRTQDCFQRCSRCQKIYRPGTHLLHIQSFIENMDVPGGRRSFAKKP